MGIAAAPLLGLVREIFERAGSAPAEAEAVADHLIEANLMGHDSHGVIRVAPYIDLLRSGKWTANRHAEIVKDAGAVVVVDGGQGLGQVIAKEATDLGIERARAHGVAVLGVRNSGHMGRIGAWAEQAALRHDLEGWVRNRRDGTVEAVVSGPESEVEAILTACREGPRGARVDAVEIVPGGDDLLRLRRHGERFSVLSTA